MHSPAASIPILKGLGSTHGATADINECATNNGGCAAGATCVNTPGSRTCSCLPGFVGNGLTCAGGRVWQHARWAHRRWRGRWGRGLRGARGPVPALHESAAQVMAAACTPLYKDSPAPLGMLLQAQASTCVPSTTEAAVPMPPAPPLLAANAHAAASPVSLALAPPAHPCRQQVSTCVPHPPAWRRTVLAV